MMNNAIFDHDILRRDLATAAEELILEAHNSRPGDLFVLGCSTSEILGVQIGKGSDRKSVV